MKTSAFLFAGIVLTVIGLICFVICIVQEDKNSPLLGLGLLCNSVGFLINCIVQHMNRKSK